MRDERAAALAGARADVDDVVGSADRVFIVFHHHQRVALVAQLAQRVQQDLVVAWMQADGRLVQHVAHALQVAAELRGQADALRFAARQARRRAIQAQVAQADLFQERQAAVNLGHHIAGDVGIPAGQIQALDPAAGLADRPLRNVDDGLVGKGDGACRRVQARAVAVRAGQVGHAFRIDFL